MLGDLLVSRELAWRLLLRNLTAQYRQTMLGYVWAFLPPLITTFTFSMLNHSGVIAVKDTSVPYPLFVLVGTVLWQAFADSVQGPVRLVTESRDLLAKVNFPREALILTAASEVVVYTMIRLLLVLGVMAWYGVPLPPSALFAPVAILGLLGFGIVIGLVLAPVALLLHDVNRGLAMVITLWFFLTPVVYPTPTVWPASMLATLNPVSVLLSAARFLFIGGADVSWSSWGLTSLATVALLLVGWLAYRLALPHVLARISA
jgi:lipopolysaccharide transport system permease protein